MGHPVEIENLSHRYGRTVIYENLNLEFPAGRIYGILGKNGVGKTTLIKILMGFLRPRGGQCRVFGDPASGISPATRERVGLLFERHLAYEFFTIGQIERFHSRFYPRWNSAIYHDMVGRLGLSPSHVVGTMSEGQRSQVVLGLLLAQGADLLILDDYSMGLDAGYRRLFIDYLREHLRDGRRTVILTSHVIQDMESFVDEIVFVERGGRTLRTSMDAFTRDFRCYRLERAPGLAPRAGECIKNVEEHPGHWDIFSFAGQDAVAGALHRQGVAPQGLRPVPMTLEDAFVGYTGRY
jgi:ABC-2 type transport system ATP-binding protein